MTAAVKCYGVQFSSPSVLQIEAGTKTQTRRVILPQPQGQHYIQPMFGTSPPPDPVAFGDPGLWREVGPDYPDGDDDDRRPPFGVVGARWWVREPFWVDERDPSAIAYQATPELYTMRWATGKTELKRAEYPTTPRDGQRPTREQMHDEFTQNKFWHQRPAMLFPRWASRFTLEVTDVRAERVQRITEADAIAEGVKAPWMGSDRWDYRGPRTHREAYAILWDQLNAKRGHPWASNPWVWVYTFTKVKQ